MSTTPTAPTPTRAPYLLAEASVTAVERLSPTFLRIELGGSALDSFGVDGPLLDQRLKLILPSSVGRLPSTDAATPDWLAQWQALPEVDRGHMRTYTVREVRGAGSDRRVVVDFALHVGEDLGPGTRWAMAARPGDRLVLLGPHRDIPFGGIEFTGLTADRLLLVGDETAVPAIAGILRDLPPTSRGDVVIEVPDPADMLPLVRPTGMAVHWCARTGAPRGAELRETVERLATPWANGATVEQLPEAEVEPTIWETPSYSSSGSELSELPAPTDLYVWIAGESAVVTGLRRHLVNEVGLARHQVAFMGYWRDGVAMRS